MKKINSVKKSETFTSGNYTIVKSPGYSALLLAGHDWSTERTCSYAVADYVMRKAKSLKLTWWDIAEYMNKIEKIA